ncbi:acyl-CoA dehydrogenase family protein [Desulfotignum balticum]|uniref:acyl-CoA dehydrogenase family protein n=1 Tax=Desulfotignum balticum TaxID=115781 RepID=UPI00040E1FCF|nr:acyl-CoA dehydrogenase family protein [Desulfotignum balticum]
MDFRFTPEEEAYQKEVREFLDMKCTQEVVHEHESGQGLGPASRALLRKMGEQNLLAPAWPKKYGGRGLSPVTRFILSEELAYHHGPYPLSCIEVAGPGIRHYGTEEQKKEFIGRIANGELEFATGYTEPDSGSDVASLQLQALEAVETDNKFIVNGQKVFNTHAHYADYMWLATRTDTTVSKHKGISVFILDMETPGIEIRPMYTFAGVRTNEVFFNNVEIPKTRLVGEKNRGWEYIVGALNYERGGTVGDLQAGYDELVDYVKKAKSDGQLFCDEAWLDEELVKLATELRIGRWLIYRVAYLQDKQLPITYEASLGKLYASQIRLHLFDVVMQSIGPYGQLRDWSKYTDLDQTMLPRYLDSPRWSIVAGTSEIQRNIMAIRGLKLPAK